LFLKQNLKDGDKVFFIGEAGFKYEIEAAGFEVIFEGPEEISMSDNEFSDFKPDPSVKMVIVGIDM
jgi:ribonucleotide monophosphatase NagD (HAD superfamily)